LFVMNRLHHPISRSIITEVYTIYVHAPPVMQLDVACTFAIFILLFLSGLFLGKVLI
jgi:hypothetical protein